MYKKVVLGVVPVKRGFLSMEVARQQKDSYMRIIREIKPEAVTLVDIDDVCENGIAYKLDDVAKVVDKLKHADIDALFLAFCDFGEEEVAAQIAAAFKLPTLVWGARDERPNSWEMRGRDTQCGMLAATKVLQRYGVTYSYIYNVRAKSEEFRQGYERFLRVSAVLRDLKNLRIAKIGERPKNFMSVMTNEANLASKFGAVCVPISASSIAERAEELIREDGRELNAYYEDLKKRFDDKRESQDSFRRVAAAKMAIEQLMKQAGCSVGAFECWSAFTTLMGICPCAAVGELTDAGMPLACENDINGAITMAILRACDLGENAEFLADMTIRHPENENGELLWHCGPFPYSLKSKESTAAIIDGRETFELKQGKLTLCRFDEIDGNYYLFAGEGRTTTGPETIGTYVWMEVDNWKAWEEKLMFGPYIHHMGVIYGSYLPVLREVARYLGVKFDNVNEQGIYSL